MFLSIGHPAASTEWGLRVCFGRQRGCLCGKCPKVHLRESCVCFSTVPYKACCSGHDGNICGRRICGGIRQPCLESACEGMVWWKHWIISMNLVWEIKVSINSVVVAKRLLWLKSSSFFWLFNNIKMYLDLRMQYEIHGATWQTVNPMITVNHFHVPEASGRWTVPLRDSVPGAGTSEIQPFQIHLLLLSTRCGTR